MKGLYQQLCDAQDALAAARNSMRHGSPSDAHDAGVRAKCYEEAIARLKQTIDSNLSAISTMEKTISSLSIPSISTAHRTLALRHVEDAQSRLIRELGDHPSK